MNMVDKKDMVYICYELNSHELEEECGSVEFLRLFKSAKDTFEFVKERIEEGLRNGFVVDKEYKATDENIMKDIESEFVGITMFSGYQENWDTSYDIIVERKEVK